jgi:UDP-glucose 4-epimerase
MFNGSNAGIEIITGDINDKGVITEALADVDTVLYFISQTFPSMNHASLKYEIENSLHTLDYTLSVMRDMNVSGIVFPSSGGTIYGDVADGMANENFPPQPVSAYGAGKLLSEEVLKYYSRAHGIDALILRISNVYGCPFYRKVQQGAVDIFIQKALSGEPIELWGEPSLLIRDHIFIDDLCSAIIALVNAKCSGAEVFNIASGVGHSIQEVIDCIEESIQKPIEKILRPSSIAGISRNVLDISKISKRTGWIPEYSLETGVKRTIERKMKRN